MQQNYEVRKVHDKRNVGSVYVCVAVRCSVLQCVAVCCSVLQCVAVCCSVLRCVAVCCSDLQCVEVCCSVFCSALQCVAVCSVYVHFGCSSIKFQTKYMEAVQSITVSFFLEGVLYIKRTVV